MGVVLGLVCGLPGRPRNRPHRARIGQRSDPTRRGMVGPRPGLPVGLSLRPPPDSRSIYLGLRLAISVP